jgi:putative DNA primase/helicase
MTGTPIQNFALLENIPNELRTRRQWLVWRLENKNGKATKVPYNVQPAQPASTNDPTTWSSFEEAQNALNEGGLNGIGFVFTAEDPYVGIDLDKCRDPETGQVEPWATQIIADLGSYTEISQSGKGLHIIAKGEPPGKKHKTTYGAGAVEIYDTGRYFIMTGNHLEATPKDIGDRTAELQKVYEKVFGEGEPTRKRVEEVQNHEPTAVAKSPTFTPPHRTFHPPIDDEGLLSLARSAENGGKFTALFDEGDLSGYESDHSAADFALCSMLSFWTGDDPDRIDRLFRRSALFRPKWDERRPGGTYGSNTISKIVKKGDSFVESKSLTNTQKGQASIRTWQDIINSETENCQHVVEGIVEEGGISLLIARQKAGKSMLVGQMSIDVSFGEPFLGQLSTKKGPVLYLDFENRPHILKARGKDLGQNREINDVHFACYQRISDRDLGLDQDNFRRLQQAVEMLKPILLVIDPLRLATSVDLNDAQKVVAQLELLSELLEINPTMAILLLHHLKKNQFDPSKTVKLRDNPAEWVDRIYGSQALLAHVETIIGLESDLDDMFTLATVPRSSNPITVVIEKVHGSQRFTLAGSDFQLRTWTKKQQDYWKKLPDEFSRQQGDEAIGHSTCDRIIRRAIQAGMLQQDKTTKKYRKTSGLPQFAGMVGITTDKQGDSSGTDCGTPRDGMGLIVPPIPPQAHVPFVI